MDGATRPKSSVYDDLIDELPVENDIWVNWSLSAGFDAGLN